METVELRELEERHERAALTWSRMKSAHEVAVRACSAAEKAFERAKTARDEAERACDAAFQVVVESRDAIRERQL
jgi:hypothetical protein